jgi:hypothetical protein
MIQIFRFKINFHIHLKDTNKSLQKRKLNFSKKSQLFPGI